MSTHHAYIRLYTLVSPPPVDHFNDSLISVSGEGSGVMRGLKRHHVVCPSTCDSMRLIGGWLTGGFWVQQEAHFKVSIPGNEGLCSPVRGRDGVPEHHGIRGRKGERHAVSWHPWDCAALPQTLQWSQGYCSWWSSHISSQDCGKEWRAVVIWHTGTAGVPSFWLCAHARAHTLSTPHTCVIESTLTTRSTGLTLVTRSTR